MSQLERIGLRKETTRSQRTEVLLIPMGNQIKMRITGKVVCSRGGKPENLPNGFTGSRDDLVWLNVFGSRQEIAKFLKRNRAIRKVIPLVHAGYSSCDRVLNS